MAKILLLNGPNLNMLGTREPEIYGSQTLEQIVADLAARASSAGHQLTSEQSNAESELIDWIQEAEQNQIEFILINPGAFTHTSIALRDALLGTKIPAIELHMSNVYQREDFRKHSYLSDVVVGCLCGFGAHSYQLALDAACNHLAINKGDSA